MLGHVASASLYNLSAERNPASLLERSVGVKILLVGGDPIVGNFALRGSGDEADALATTMP